MNKLKIISIFMAALIIGLAASTAFTAVTSATPLEERVNVDDVLTVTSVRGAAIFAENGEISSKDASLTMTIKVTEVGEHGFKFQVESGTIEIDGEEFTMTTAEGGLKMEKGKGAFVGVKGEVQGGEFRLGGKAGVRRGRLGVGLRGPLCVGDTLYWLSFLAVVNRV